VEGAALLAGRAERDAHDLAEAFCHLGVLFQLQDDVLDLYGNKGRDSPGSDIREGKISALVVEHLALHPGDAPWLRELLAAPRDATPHEDVVTAIARFREGGALAAVLRRIREEAEAALVSSGLRDEPGLGALAEELIQVTLAPIAHLLDER
jgi:geranylgeranyl diphosphate synthase type I